MALQPTTRGGFLRRGAVAGGALAAGVPFAIGLADDADSASGKETDEKVLRYLLELEQLQAAFYAKAVKDGALKGGVAEYANTVAEQEHQHVDLLEKALGGKGPKAADYDFGDATSGNGKFLAVAVDLEEVGLSAYSGAAAQVTPGVLREAAKILSVEARHTSWARDLADRNPAPKATDKARSQQQVLALVRRTGFRKAP